MKCSTRVQQVFSFLVYLCLLVAQISSAQTCVRPCLPCANSGQCMSTVPYNNTDGQIFGTCNCTDTGYTGPQCQTPVGATCPSECHHDGVCDIIAGACKCEEQYTLNDCTLSRCVNLVSGIPQPAGTNGECPEPCKIGYGGPYCREIVNSEACPVGTEWSDVLATSLKSMNIHCSAIDDGWVSLVSGTTDLVLQCEKESGWLNATPDGSCRFDFYRNHSSYPLYEELFSCNFSECNWNFGGARQDPTAASQYVELSELGVAQPKGAAALRYILFVFCVIVALLGFFSEHIPWMSYLLPTSVILVVFVLLLNLFVAAPVYADANKKNVIESGFVCSSSLLEMNCNKSHCLCNPLARGSTNCGDSSMFYSLVTELKRNLHFTCDAATHNCSFTHADLWSEAFRIGLFCHGRNCLTEQPKVEKIACEEPKSNLAVILVASIIGGIALCSLIASIVLHFVNNCSSAAEFNALSHAPNGTVPKNSDNSVLVAVRNINYSVRNATTENRNFAPDTISILNDVSIEFPPGCLTAVMGPSGCGKTTLLDILCFREKCGFVSGEISISSPEGPVQITSQNLDAWRRVLSYVADDDAVLPTLTVREALRYTVHLRQPVHIEDTVKEQFVQMLISTFQLDHCADTLIGMPTGIEDSGRGGLSAGERRRTAIAVHLACLPRVLVLDEPTTGLDAFNARHVISCLNAACHGSTGKQAFSLYEGYYPTELCAYRPTIILSIHQPSMDIMRHFDHLVLMARGRVLLACAPTEKNLKGFVAFAQSHRLGKEEDGIDDDSVALSDKILLLVSTQRVDGTPTYSPTSDETTKMISSSRALVEVVEFEKYLPHFWTQFRLLLQRGWTHVVRRNSILALHYLVASVVALLISLMYESSDRDVPGTLSKAGAFTFYYLWLAVLNLSALDLLIAERATFTFERNASYYSTGAYYLSKLLIDVVALRIIPTAVSSSLMYFPIGLKPTVGAFSGFVGITILFSVTTTGLAILIAALAPGFGSGLLINGFAIIILFAFGGFISQSNSIPVGLRWLKYISPFNFAFEITMVRDMEGQLCSFQPRSPDGTPTTEKAVTLQCEQYLYNLNLRTDRVSLDIALLVAWGIVYYVLAFIVLVFLVRGKR